MSNSNKNSKFAELMESNRQRKVAQIIQEDFAELFRKQASESKQSILVSVSDVKVTPDLGIAKIYLSIFPQEHRSSIMKEIEENKAQYRNFIGQKMAKQVRIIPQLSFYLDTTLDDVERIEKELRGEGENPVL
ncbi:ribosome-binding factor A [Chryseobacterium formosense]|nr:ribosome-binding factor A [Chryseobacterium formosense]